MSALPKDAEDYGMVKAHHYAERRRLAGSVQARSAAATTARLQAVFIREKATLRKVFSSYDKNGDGTISIAEFEEGMRAQASQWGLTSAQITGLMQSVDQDESGYIDYHEFAQQFHIKEPTLSSQTRFCSAAALGDLKAVEDELTKRKTQNKESGSQGVNALRLKSEPRGKSALINAAMSGRLEVVTTLLSAMRQAGSLAVQLDINHQDQAGWSALMHAVSHGHVEVTRRLLREGADSTLRDERGRTVHDLARAFAPSAAVMEAVAAAAAEQGVAATPTIEELLSLYSSNKDQRGLPRRYWNKCGLLPESQLHWQHTR